MCTELNYKHGVKTRKPHSCFGCNTMQQAGTVMTVATYVEGGDIWTNYNCDICQDVLMNSGESWWQEGDAIEEPEVWIEAARAIMDTELASNKS